ncbi:two-component response regulator ARR12-like [Apium graveolens]|uniref:two-component response regulator ARR12-like n=2 Tax=Apium graveolens TaxID=4045 RepID=UPI003D7B27BB
MEISKLNNQNNGSNNGSTREKMVTILVVDDDRNCLSLIASLLKGCAYRVLTAKDPLDALRILRTGVIKFDLVVSDVHMPGMDGFELQRWIHQDFQLPVLYSSVNDLHQQTNQTHEILLLVMSGDREASNLCEGSQSGASLFVVKPITTEDMKSIWDFVNQWKKNLAKGKNLVSDDSSAKDNEDDTGNKLYEKKSKRKLQITDNEDHNHGKNRVLKDKAFLTKKNKLNWTPFLHDKFVRAVQHLGPQGSIPRNIVTVMNVPGLRREQVASHLQVSSSPLFSPFLLCDENF